MKRGFYKVWRKQEDSRFWSMGALYVGVWTMLLQKANYRDSYFLGEKVAPGELVVGIEALAKEARVSYQSMRTVLKHFVEWGQISTNQLANRATKITIANWHTYNGQADDDQRTDQQAANEQLTSNQRAANDILRREEGEEGKKKKEDTKAAPAAPDAAAVSPPPVVPPTPTRAPRRPPPVPPVSVPYSPEFEAFWSAWPIVNASPKGSKMEAWEQWQRLPAAVLAELPAAVAGRRGFPPDGCDIHARHVCRWLSKRCWESDPPAALGAPATRTPEQLAADEALRKHLAEGRKQMGIR